MDVKTGEILADASLANTKSTRRAGHDPSGAKRRSPGIEQTVNNLAFSQTYEPDRLQNRDVFGGVAGRIDHATSVITVPPSVVVGGRYFHDAEQHRSNTSRDSGTRALVQHRTYESAHAWARTSVDASHAIGIRPADAVNSGQSSGLLVNTANWYASDQVALPIGQVDAVPPIQVLDAYNAIANGGVFVEPKLYVATCSRTARQGHCPARSAWRSVRACRPRW